MTKLGVGWVSWGNAGPRPGAEGSRKGRSNSVELVVETQPPLHTAGPGEGQVAVNKALIPVLFISLSYGDLVRL